MAALQPVRGTHDLMGDEMRLFRHVVETVRRIAAQYGCGEIAPPIFEFSEVFHRTLGETSDVVSKETYSFTDRGGEAITLRPEFTAGVVRAFLTGGQTQNLPFKAFYAGPAFRYERPQKGRLRQFHQIGIEMLGADQPWNDVEVIACGWRMLQALGLGEVTLEVNTLGDAESRASYRTALVEYFQDHRADLSEDSQRRLTANPLRILDSKDEGDKRIVAGAPEMRAQFTSAAGDWFAEVEAGLCALAIPYTINPRLVRGLDYYSHSVFEFTSKAIGAQGTVLAGGRYDGLVELMGGPHVPGIGFAAGIERLMLLLEGRTAQEAVCPIALLPVGETPPAEALILAEALRGAGHAVEIVAHRNMSKALKKADKLGARLALLLGDDERAAGDITLRDMAKGEQKRLPQSELIAALKSV